MLKMKHNTFLALFSMLILLVLSGCASIEKAEALHRQGEKQEALEMVVMIIF